MIKIPPTQTIRKLNVSILSNEEPSIQNKKTFGNPGFYKMLNVQSFLPV